MAIRPQARVPPPAAGSPTRTPPIRRTDTETILLPHKALGALPASTLALVCATPALAQDAGTIQIKGFVTGVLPDGEITDVRIDNMPLPAGSQVRATDS